MAVVSLLFFSCFAQAQEKTAPTASVQTNGQVATASPGGPDSVASAIALLRKSLGTLNARLREISDKFNGADLKDGDPKNALGRLTNNLELLNKAEQRAEVMRKELLDLVERETSYKSRMMQLEEDMRPENLDRAMNLVGSTRAYEIKETRKRSLENDRAGIEILLRQTSQSRIRLDEDVRQADLMVSRIRQKLLPEIDRQIDNLIPNRQ